MGPILLKFENSKRFLNHFYLTLTQSNKKELTIKSFIPSVDASDDCEEQLLHLSNIINYVNKFGVKL